MTRRSAASPESQRISERVQGIPASGIRRFFDLLASMEGVISLGVGEPDFVTPEVIRRAAIRSIEDGKTHYTSNFGLPELRERISAHLERLYGVHYDPRTEVLVTTGVSEGLNLACQAVLNEGDEVLVPDPSYVAYPPNATLAGGVVVHVPTHASEGFRLHAEDLEQCATARSRALVLGYPANPTGAEMRRAEWDAVADVCVRHDLTVISDEIYDRLTYGVTHTCAAALPGMRERTILLGGFSKAYAMTGWRLGWLCAPVPLLEAAMKVHQYVMMSAPTVSQYAGIAALDHGEPSVQEMLTEYTRRRRLIVDGLNGLGLQCGEPEGAFYAFPDISPTGMTDEAFAETLLREERIAVVPGSAFGPGGAGHVRACYATAYEQIEQSLERLTRFVQRHRAA